MTVWCLEIRNTQQWTDVRFRRYTRSEREAKAFRHVPKIEFTDSLHGLVPTVSEHTGRRQTQINTLSDHVRASMRQRNKKVASMPGESHKVPLAEAARIVWNAAIDEAVKEIHRTPAFRKNYSVIEVTATLHALDLAGKCVERLKRLTTEEGK